MKTPCNKTCQIHPVTGLCLGCHRSLEEIGSWSRYSDTQRAHIMAELPTRTPAQRTEAQ
ncbi:DUF1289 domain-containing protein [Roseibium limicola]|uniref:DUF1289 domain-containing protein n=1 Tax=Roseibium limicola TaxID=2816037 RepID=A0A939J8N9_9HYPH|nr:DUF1289 domain-containing protein [Roseibium limicola]MBO0345069.1 DUF1289 domain-containing protein [Roseibium limicola]